MSRKYDHMFLVEDSILPLIVHLLAYRESCTPPLLCPSNCFVAVVQCYFFNTRHCTLQVFINWYKNSYIAWFIFVFKSSSKGI